MNKKTSSSLPPLPVFILLLFTLISAALVLPSAWGSLHVRHGLISADGQYVGRDFTFFYSAAKQALAGKTVDLYSTGGLQRAMEFLLPAAQQNATPPWPYPPHTMLLFAPLAWLDYMPALAVWLAVSLLLPMWVLWRYWHVRGVLFLVALLNINVIYCLTMGQNTLLLAGFVGLGIALIPTHPLLAGVCFAITSIKPQVALLIPIGLLLAGYWRVLLYTIAVTLGLIAASCLAFGWQGWLQLLTYGNELSGTYLSPDSWYLTMYCTYRALLGLGASPIWAAAGHSVVAILALYCFYRLWRANVPLAERWLGLGLAAELITPYSYAYDAPWVVLPLIAWVAGKLKQQNMQAWEYCLFALQAFSFLFYSLWPQSQLLIIASGLALLWIIAHKKRGLA